MDGVLSIPPLDLRNRRDCQRSAKGHKSNAKSPIDRQYSTPMAKSNASVKLSRSLHGANNTMNEKQRELRARRVLAKREALAEGHKLFCTRGTRGGAKRGKQSGNKIVGEALTSAGKAARLSAPPPSSLSAPALPQAAPPRAAPTVLRPPPGFYSALPLPPPVDDASALRAQLAALQLSLTASKAAEAAAERRGRASASAAAEEGAACVVCLDAAKDCALMPCRHLCVCAACAEDLLRAHPACCPICRAAIESSIRLFTT